MEKWGACKGGGGGGGLYIGTLRCYVEVGLVTYSLCLSLPGIYRHIFVESIVCITKQSHENVTQNSHFRPNAHFCSTNGITIWTTMLQLNIHYNNGLFRCPLGAIRY